MHQKHSPFHYYSRDEKGTNNVYEDAIRPTIVRNALAWLYQQSELWRKTTIDQEKLNGLEGMQRMEDFISKVLESSRHGNNNVNDKDDEDMDVDENAPIFELMRSVQEENDDELAENLDTLLTQ